MRVGYNALFGVFSDRQSLLFKWTLDNMSVERPILKRSVIQTNTQTDPRPTNQRSSNPFTCGYDGFTRGHRPLFNCRALGLQTGSCRHSPSERTSPNAVPNSEYPMLLPVFMHYPFAVFPEVLFADKDHNPRHDRLEGDISVPQKPGRVKIGTRTTFPKTIWMKSNAC